MPKTRAEEIAEERARKIGLKNKEELHGKQNEEITYNQERIMKELEEEINQHSTALANYEEINKKYIDLEEKYKQAEEKLKGTENQLKFANNYIETLERRPIKTAMKREEEAINENVAKNIRAEEEKRGIEELIAGIRELNN